MMRSNVVLTIRHGESKLWEGRSCVEGGRGGREGGRKGLSLGQSADPQEEVAVGQDNELGAGREKDQFEEKVFYACPDLRDKTQSNRLGVTRRWQLIAQRKRRARGAMEGRERAGWGDLG